MEPSSTFTSIGSTATGTRQARLEKKVSHPRQLGRLGGETLAALVGLLNPSLFPPLRVAEHPLVAQQVGQCGAGDAAGAPQIKASGVAG